MPKIYHLPCIVSLLQLTACASLPGVMDRGALAEEIAENGGLTASYIDAGTFVLKSFHKGLDTHPETLHVYIEGDGFAWKRRGQISNNPTPKNPVALRLAVQDPSPAVLYIARPCQYRLEGASDACEPKYWTSHRYSEDVVAAMDKAIGQVVKESGADHVGLVGYSGGGTIAALIAVRRNDTSWLVTVAGNLDHTLWTDSHHISPLTGSLNAADFADHLVLLPQVHFAGGRDRIVTADVINSFVRRMGEADASRSVIIPEYDHSCCWQQDWPGLMCRYKQWQLDYCRKASN